MKREIVAIGIAVLGSFCLPLLSVRADTNSWTYTGANPNSYFWHITTSWFLGTRPSPSDNLDYITNSTTKTVTINQTDTTSFQSSLTVTNLIVSAPSGTTNTLFLNNAATNVSLHIFNALTLGSGGVLQITNSFLEVDQTNGTFQLDGTFRTYGLAKVQSRTITMGSGAVLEFALGTNSSPIVVNNNLTVAGTLNVTDGGGFTNTTYTLFAYGGTLTDNGLAVGSMPSNTTGVIDTSTLGQVKLVVSQTSPVSSSMFAVTSIIQQSNDVLITWSTTGAGTTNIVQVCSGAADGSYSNNFTNLSGNILITTATTNYLDVGGATNSPSRFYRVLGPGSAQGNLDTDGDGIPDAWMQQYFGHPTGQAGDHSLFSDDADGDGLSNLAEYLAGTDPTNSASALRITSILQSNDDIVVTWSTAGGYTNMLQVSSGDVGSYTNDFGDVQPVGMIIAGSGDATTNYTDLGGATNTPSRFYRVRLVP